MKYAVAGVFVVVALVGTMEIGFDGARVKQDDEMLGQISNSIDREFGFGEADAAGFGYTEAGAEHGDVDVVQ